MPQPTSPRRAVVAGLVLAMLAAGPAPAQDAASATAARPVADADAAVRDPGTGLPLPRFVSLARDEVNMRAGPGEDFPIRWVLRRRGMPVKIVGELKEWRRVVDLEGSEGWIHSRLLSSRRTVVITGPGIRDLRRSASADARVVLRAEPGVVGGLVSCEGSWCLVEIDERRGWIERSALWGVLDDEMSD